MKYWLDKQVINYDDTLRERKLRIRMKTKF